VVAGPRTTRILADLGADVIKIERMPDPGTSARDVRGRFDMWGNLNAGKRSVALDLGRPEGRDLARRIIGLSDLVIDNFSPRVMSNLGLDQATLRSARPDLIVVSLAGPGHSGPRRDWVTFGPTIQALTGHTSLIGEPGLPPAGYGFAYVDLMSGSAGALAALAAMEHRRRTGEGCFVDLSQWEVGASLIGPAWLDLTANGREAGQDGRLSPDGPAAPDGIYQCAGDDRWCVITCRDETEWRAFRDTIGPPPWTDDPRFASLADRIAHRAELDALVGARTRRYPAVELVERLQAVGVPAGVVQDARDLIERDPQLRHRGHWLEQTDPESGPGRVEALPIRIDGEPTPPRGLSPYPGEDTDEVLLDLLGLSRERVARLRTAGIVGGSP
ncbi:MAG TPA: CoA transferase, partial [Dehalococcoidia bacterium]|nr:CoA transferase [Dehalococcoidia bacterium]